MVSKLQIQALGRSMIYGNISQYINMNAQLLNGRGEREPITDDELVLCPRIIVSVLRYDKSDGQGRNRMNISPGEMSNKSFRGLTQTNWRMKISLACHSFP